MTLCLVLETRNGSGAFNGMINVQVGGTACLPATAVDSVLSYLTLWPAGASQPLVSTLNAPDGAITSNMAIVPVAGGSFSVYGTNAAQLILDFSGYFAP